jgi:hypothetical protein
MRQLVILLVLSCFASQSFATRGGVDSEGCHKPKKSARHCHGDRAGGGYAGGAETHGQRDRRLLRECRGAVSAGVCRGYTR